MNGAEQKQEAGRGCFRFPRESRLLKHLAFDRVYREGERLFAGHLTVFFRRRDEPERGPRVGFTVSRALGGAVERNRMKRRLREAVRRHLFALTVAVDVVINPKKTVLTADFAQIESQVDRAFASIQQRLGDARSQAKLASPAGTAVREKQA